MNRKLRILCMHGYRQSNKSFREKTGGLRKGLKSLAEFDFVCAPHQVHVEADSYSWFYSNPATHNVLSYACLDKSAEDPGFDESVDFILNYIKENGPYDGILSFSQGACFTSMLFSIMKENQTYNSKIYNSINFGIFFCGFKSRITKHNKYYTSMIHNVRTLHIYGETDEVIPTEMSENLVASFIDPQTLKHPGGHFVPTSALVRNVCKQFLIEEMKLIK